MPRSRPQPWGFAPPRCQDSDRRARSRLHPAIVLESSAWIGLLAGCRAACGPSPVVDRNSRSRASCRGWSYREKGNPATVAWETRLSRSRSRRRRGWPPELEYFAGRCHRKYISQDVLRLAACGRCRSPRPAPGAACRRMLPARHVAGAVRAKRFARFRRGPSFPPTSRRAGPLGAGGRNWI